MDVRRSASWPYGYQQRLSCPLGRSGSWFTLDRVENEHGYLWGAVGKLLAVRVVRRVKP